MAVTGKDTERERERQRQRNEVNPERKINILELRGKHFKFTKLLSLSTQVY